MKLFGKYVYVLVYIHTYIQRAENQWFLIEAVGALLMGYLDNVFIVVV